MKETTTTKTGGSLPADVAKLADAVAAQHGVPPALVRGVIWVESRGNPKAKSHKGAIGLMQLMPLTAAGLGVNDPWNPHANVDGGTRYLADMLRKYRGNEEQALAAYNWGPGNVDTWLGTRTPGGPALQLPRSVAAYVAAVQQRAMIEADGSRTAEGPFRSSSVELSCPSCSHAFSVVVDVEVLR